MHLDLQLGNHLPEGVFQNPGQEGNGETLELRIDVLEKTPPQAAKEFLFQGIQACHARPT